MSRLLALLVAALLVGCADGAPSPAPAATDAGVPALHPSIDGYPEATVVLTDGEERIVVPVKVADTQERRQHGFMEVPDIPAGVGMLFVFPEDTDGAFWMKNTLVPLSIAYVSADGSIVSILDMEPCEADPCPVYEPGGTYRYALEVPRGWFDEVGVTEEWTVDIRS